YGFVKTSSSSYTTDNLKFKVYILEGGVFTPVTDVAAVSNLNDGVAHFVKNNVNYAILLPANSTKSLYVAFWINEITASQNADQEKDLNCRIGFEGVGGSQVSVSFDV
ncbi:MAG: hypothetical protein IJH34_14085, partial [Romboutsia sp.]|nr:hypothetical protein [Romboutsia sp.]